MATIQKLNSKANIKNLTNMDIPYAPTTTGSLSWTMTNALSLTNGGTVPISYTVGLQGFRISSSSGAITLSTTPFGASKPTNGAIVRLFCVSDTNTVQITSSDIENGCITNGSPILVNGSSIEFQFVQGAASTDDRWIEINRNF